ncbi:hypothetical protein LINPERHAP1_LOCUS30427, partial [Linum perenne]
PTPPQDAPTTNEAINTMTVDSAHVEESVASGSEVIHRERSVMGNATDVGKSSKLNSSNIGTNGLKNRHESCERKFKDSETKPKFSYQDG